MKIKQSYENIIFCVLTGVGAAVSFPKPGLFFLIWIAFTPLLTVLIKGRVKTSFFYALLSGFVFNAVGLYWLVAMLRFNTGSYVQAFAASCALWMYLALFWGAWGLFVSIAKKRFSSVWVLAVFGASLWVLLEYARTYFLTGFPWMLIGYSQYKFAEIIQIAEFTGVYGASFIIIFVNFLLSSWLMEAKSNKYVLAALGLIIALSVFGAWRLDKFKFFGDKEFSVSIIQPNIDQYKKWDDVYKEEILLTLETLAAAASKQKNDLVIWPETVLPDSVPFGRHSYLAANKIAQTTDALNIMGSSYSSGLGAIFNVSLAFSPRGNGYFAIHKKNHLVPFGEYVPFRKQLGAAFGVLNEMGDISKGGDAKVFKYKDIFAGSTICSENFFPNISRRFVLNGAKVLTNHTNDAWFFDTAAPHQHFIMNVFRAVENRKAALVCANSGISGIIEASGRIIVSTPSSEETFISGSFLQNDFLSFYTLRGDVFVKICAVITLLLFAVMLVI
ncbi:MAG: apolipoprotein N-acyltransferase [Endomicrobium sp.]|jgi:apolipoprotein N-acyltransferase|nr:apolipoprotein N-acyltransferase [Endomicrobium sp.]